MSATTPVRPVHARRSRRSRRALALAATAAAAMLTLSGCITLDMGLSVQEDDTVDGTIVLAVDKKALELLGQDPEQAFEGSAPGDLFGGDLGGGEVQTEVYDQDGKYGQKYTFADVPLATFSGSTEADGDTLSIRREGEFFVLDGTLDLSDAAAAAGGETGAPDELTQQILDSLDFRVAVTFPGEVVETNGELDGTTVTWTPEPGELVTMNAKARTSGGAVPADGTVDNAGGGTVSGSDAEPASSTSPIVPWAIAALALLALAGLLVVLLRRGAKSGAVSPIDRPRTDDDDPFLLGGSGAPAAADLGRPDLASRPTTDTVVLQDGVPTDVVEQGPDDARPQV